MNANKNSNGTYLCASAMHLKYILIVLNNKLPCKLNDDKKSGTMRNTLVII